VGPRECERQLLARAGPCGCVAIALDDACPSCGEGCGGCSCMIGWQRACMHARRAGYERKRRGHASLARDAPGNAGLCQAPPLISMPLWQREPAADTGHETGPVSQAAGPRSRTERGEVGRGVTRVSKLASCARCAPRGEGRRFALFALCHRQFRLPQTAKARCRDPGPGRDHAMLLARSAYLRPYASTL